MADPELAFPGGRPGAGVFLLRGQEKVTKEKATPVNRAFASPVLLDELGVCGTRSKNEKTRKDFELRQVLDHGTELICVTRQLTRGSRIGGVAKRAMPKLPAYEFQSSF